MHIKKGNGVRLPVFENRLSAKVSRCASTGVAGSYRIFGANKYCIPERTVKVNNAARYYTLLYGKSYWNRAQRWAFGQQVAAGK